MIEFCNGKGIEKIDKISNDNIIEKVNEIFSGYEGGKEYDSSKPVFKKENINSFDVQKLSLSKEEKPEKEREEVKQIRTRNETLEGKKHPETKILYERKTVENDEGKKVEGVFPVFESIKDVQLPKELEKSTDAEQFKECNKQLKEAVSKDEKLKEKFDIEQLEQIENGDTPDGYTWHHSEEKGKMQLIDSDVHAKTGHTGGKCIWGGGSENR